MSMIRGIALLASLAFVMGADKAEPEPAKPPKADVRGEVTSVSAVNGRATIGNMLIEGAKEKDTTHDKASVSVERGAKFFKWSGGKKVAAKFEDVKVGCKVQCDFNGPVRESYPVQAGTREVLILESPKKK